MQTKTPDLQSEIAALLAAAPAPGTAAPQIKPSQRIPLTAMTNALTGQDMFLEEHEYPAYMDLGAQFMAELRPVGVRETQLAQKIIDLNWRLNTMSAVENNLFHSSRLNHIDSNDPSSDKVVGMTSKATTWRADCEGPNAFEKLGRHESRVQRNLFRISAEIERFQTIRLKKGADTFVLADCKAWVWYDHMLALHTQLAAERRAEDIAEVAPREAESATPAESTASNPELLCKKPESPPGKYKFNDDVAAPLIRYASANGLLTPDQQQLFELLQAS